MTTKMLHGTITKALASGGLGPDEFIANLVTGSLDLEGDRVSASGATPPAGTMALLWNHNPDHVVGKAEYSIRGSTVEIKGLLLPLGSSPQADLCRVLVKGGFAISVSAGFAPITTAPIKGTTGKTYSKYALLEASLVAVPADQNAKITARSFEGGTDRESRMRRAEAFARVGKMQDAQIAVASAPVISYADRQRKAAQIRARGQGAPASPGACLAYSPDLQRSIKHCDAVAALQARDNPTVEDRMRAAERFARATRLEGY